MRRRTGHRAATVTILLSALVAALVANPLPVAAQSPFPLEGGAAQRSADLAPALGADGAFLGSTYVAGTVDTSAWTLVSDLTSGAPPRFAQAERQVSETSAQGWSALGSNGSGNGALYDGAAEAIAVSGSDLYVGGCFENAAGILTADFVAKWDGTTWSALGSNGSGNGALNSCVRTLAVSGTDLYVGGHFTNAAGIPKADYVAKWDGSTWSALGSNGPSDYVEALAVSGANVYVGGQFKNVAGIPEADLVSKWDGSTWSALGSNGSGDGALGRSDRGDAVLALAVSGTDLYVGGTFLDAGGISTADKVAMWDGNAWSALGSNGSGDGALNNNVYALVSVGSDVYVGGGFSDAAGIATADYLAKWDGNAWTALGSNGSGDGSLGGLDRNDRGVYDLAVSGSNLYVGGVFKNAAGILQADFVAMWDGNRWAALGSDGSGDGALSGGLRPDNNGVGALAARDGDLFVGGDFTDAAGIAEADYVASFEMDSVAVDTVPPLATLELSNGALTSTTRAMVARVEGHDAETAVVSYRLSDSGVEWSPWSAWPSGAGSVATQWTVPSLSA